MGKTVTKAIKADTAAYHLGRAMKKSEDELLNLGPLTATKGVKAICHDKHGVRVACWAKSAYRVPKKKTLFGFT